MMMMMSSETMIYSAGHDPSPQGADPSRGPDSSRGALIRPKGSGK